MKQVSLSKLLIKQIMLAILAGLLISLPITLIPAYFFVQSNIQTQTEHLQKLSHKEVAKHLSSGWQQSNIDLIFAHLKQEIPSATFYMQKHPDFIKHTEKTIAIDSKPIQKLIEQVQANNQTVITTDILNGKLYAAYPIKFEQTCLACHQAEVKAGTIKLNQQAGAIAYETPFSTATVSVVTQILFFLLFMGTFIGIALYLTNRSIHQKLLFPLQDLSKRIASLKLDNHAQLVDWRRSKHAIIEVDQIDERISQHIQAIQGIYSKLDALIVTEHETGLFHKERFNEVMSYELMRAKRYEHEFCVIVIKLLGTESSNTEVFNTLSEEEQLAAQVHAFSQHISNDSRITDLAFRINEEVFVIIAPETGLEGAMMMQEHLLSDLKGGKTNSSNEEDYLFNFNFKMGYAVYPADGLTAKQLMHEAAIRMNTHDY